MVASGGFFFSSNINLICCTYQNLNKTFINVFCFFHQLSAKWKSSVTNLPVKNPTFCHYESCNFWTYQVFWCPLNIPKVNYIPGEISFLMEDSDTKNVIFYTTRFLGWKCLPKKVRNFGHTKFATMESKWQNTIKLSQNHYNSLKIH